MAVLSRWSSPALVALISLVDGAVAGAVVDTVANEPRDGGSLAPGRLRPGSLIEEEVGEEDEEEDEGEASTSYQVWESDDAPEFDEAAEDRAIAALDEGEEDDAVEHETSLGDDEEVEAEEGAEEGDVEDEEGVKAAEAAEAAAASMVEGDGVDLLEDPDVDESGDSGESNRIGSPSPLALRSSGDAMRRLGDAAAPAVVAGNGKVAEAPETTTAVGAAPKLEEALVNVSEISNSSTELSDGHLVMEALSFDYHKTLFPLNMRQDGLTIALAIVGLMIAASGGIGGGGILVPLFMLVLGFRPKHAIALSNFTIFGGSIANTVINVRKRHPRLDKPLIDWDLILIMEPFTIFGAVFGSLLSKVLPNAILTTTLVAILAFMGHRTFGKGVKMWSEESKLVKKRTESNNTVEMLTPEVLSMTEATSVTAPSGMDSTDGPELNYLELQSDSETSGTDEKPVSFKVGALTFCFVGTCVITLLKGGGNFPSPLGFGCGSGGFWLLYFGSLPWVLAFAIYFRWLLVGEYQRKLFRGHIFSPGEVEWDSWNTIKYPAICAISGLLAGLFGVGGGIVKGPLMLEMGIPPAVSSASAAAMILFTSAAASTSFVVFGLLHHSYGALFFGLGFVSTMVGQYSVSILVERYNRQSPIVLSIGGVICLSSVLVAINTVVGLMGPDSASYFEAHGVCSTQS